MTNMTPQGLAFFEAHKRELSNLHVVSQVADRVFHFVSNFRHAGDQTTQLRGIHTIIRDKECERSDFVFQSDRLIRMVVEEALSLLPTEPRSVTTPTGVSYDGLRFGSKLCAVSIPRSGDTMEQGVRQVRREERRSRWSEGVVFDSNVRGIGDSRCADWQDFDSARRAHGQARVAVLEAAA